MAGLLIKAGMKGAKMAAKKAAKSKIPKGHKEVKIGRKPRSPEMRSVSDSYDKRILRTSEGVKLQKSPAEIRKSSVSKVRKVKK